MCLCFHLCHVPKTAVKSTGHPHALSTIPTHIVRTQFHFYMYKLTRVYKLVVFPGEEVCRN